MLPNDKKKLQCSDKFKELVAYAMSEAVKNQLDVFTIPLLPSYAEPANGAEARVLSWLREKMQQGNILDHTVKQNIAKSNYVLGVLSLFDNTAGDTISFTEDEQGAVWTIDWDTALPVIVGKVGAAKYLYGLGGWTEFLASHTAYNAVTGQWSLT